MTARRDVREQLRAELQAAAQPDGTFRHADLRELAYLDGFLTEVLRMEPAVYSNSSRMSPPEGLTVGDRYIPGNVELFLPINVYHHCKLRRRKRGNDDGVR